MSRPQQARISVVIPTFNDGPMLDRAVRSAIEIDAVSRVIIVDDGSDPAAGLAEELRAGSVVLIRTENRGPSAARNTAIERVLETPLEGAEWIVFLDADDELRPGVADAVAKAHAEGAVAMVGGRTEVWPDGSKKDRPPPEEWADRVLPRPGDVFRPIQLFATTGMSVARDAAEQGLRFDPELIHGPDRDFIRRAADLGSVFVAGDEVVWYHKRGDGMNMSGSQHMTARVRDFRKTLARHHDPESDEHFRRSATRLLNEYSKAATDSDGWQTLVREFRARGWPLRYRSAMRFAIRRLLRATS